MHGRYVLARVKGTLKDTHLAHHDATEHDEGDGAEAELFSSEQSAHDDIKRRSDATVDVQNNAVTQTVHHQTLLRL
jgi:hypothetical protein